jgi:RNA polymerase sigma-70 factor (ECF subfamily)
MVKEKTTLELIYEKYRNRMYMAAYRIVKNPTVAEDVLHDTFVALSKNTEKLKNIDSLYTASYVTKAARNHALNTIKKAQQSNIVSIEEIDIVSDESVLDELCTEENVSIIVSSILALDEKYRDVLSLYYFNELTVSEIAVSLGKKESTVKQQLARGRRRLIDTIKKEVDGYE